MANTRDSLGDQATLDGLVAHTLTSFEEDGVTTLRNYAMEYNDTIQSVNFPNLTNTGRYAFRECTALKTATLPEATTIGDYAFSGCDSLDTVSIPKATALNQYCFQNCSALEELDLENTSKPTIGVHAFDGCTSLTHLIIRSSTMASLNNTNALTKTKIFFGEGGVYVPSSLVSTYKANSSWGDYGIFPISEYPKTDFCSITDTWAQIAAAESDGTYNTKYSVGDTKSFTIDGDTYIAQIAAFDADALANGTGNAKITWLLYKKHLADTQKMNTSNTTTGGWASCALRAYLRDTIYPSIQSEVRGMIKEVTKTYYDYASTSTLSTTDTVWIPSLREVNGTSSGSYVIESSGPIYSGLFPTNGNGSQTARVKYNASGSANLWWLRSAYSATYFDCVNGNGNISNYSATYTYGVVLGFCT